MKVAFDQNGNIYPPSPNDLGLDALTLKGNGNYAFDISKRYRDKGQSYDQDKIYTLFSQQIAQKMALSNTRSVVFLVKGFNNSYEGFDRDFDRARTFVLKHARNPKIAIVQIYWDGLYTGQGSFPLPATSFRKSLTYSNIAGQVGLRRLVNRLPEGSDIIFITHSRGAAVAISALSDPVYDAGIAAPPHDSVRGGKIASARLVAFAPAIGDGHMRQADLFSYFKSMDFGFNKNDPATNKAFLPSRMNGDTRLNANNGYFEDVAKHWNASGKGLVERETFRAPSHDWADYIAQEPQALCLLWAVQLAEKPATACEVTP